jgi:hypothetical protein
MVTRTGPAEHAGTEQTIQSPCESMRMKLGHELRALNREGISDPSRRSCFALRFASIRVIGGQSSGRHSVERDRRECAFHRVRFIAKPADRVLVSQLP